MFKEILNDRRKFNRRSQDIKRKVTVALIGHVYQQTFMGLFASTFCFAIVFVGLFSVTRNNTSLYICGIFFALVIVIRLLQLKDYQQTPSPAIHLNFWKMNYIIGSFFGGLSWGLPAILLLHHVNPMEQTLLFLMLAGVTAGAATLSSAVPQAAMAFLIAALAPYIVSIALLPGTTYLLFNMALTVYLFYSLIMVGKTSKLISESIFLKFKNDALLVSLNEAKNALEKSNKRFEIAATHDSLTGVANRNLFHINLKSVLAHAKEYHHGFALLYIDIDKFKAINDTFGHQIGDEVLLTMVARIRTCLGSAEYIARLGGDELTVILENVFNKKEVITIAKSICDLAAKPVVIENTTLETSISIGISIYPEDGQDMESLIRIADANMYYVKERGGNNFYLGSTISTT